MNRRAGLLQRLAFWRAGELQRAGDTARDRRDWARAAASYEAHLAVRPARWQIRVQLGHAYKEMGDISAAEVAYLAASEAAPDDADVFLQLARAYVSGGKIKSARAAYRRSCALDPAGPAVFESEGFEREHPNDPDEEGGAGPGANNLWRGLSDARAARDMRNWDEAEQLYRFYLQGDAGAAEVWVELAQVLESADRHSDALDALRRARGLNPSIQFSLGGGSLGGPDAAADLWS
jgi:tetratricopeptide (TPR) repeat protein